MERRFKILIISDDLIEEFKLMLKTGRLKNRLPFWTEPELPNDLKIVDEITNLDDGTMCRKKLVLYSKTFDVVESIPDMPPIVIHTGKKPYMPKPFVFR